MPKVSNHPTPRSQKILRGLSFLSLGYLAYMMMAFIYTVNTHGSGVENNLGLVFLAICFAGLFLGAAFRQLFSQTRRLIVLVFAVVVGCNVGQILFIQSIKARIELLQSPEASVGFISTDLMYPIWMFAGMSLLWYLPLVFPFITNFRNLPTAEPVAA